LDDQTKKDQYGWEEDVINKKEDKKNANTTIVEIVTKKRKNEAKDMEENKNEYIKKQKMEKNQELNVNKKAETQSSIQKQKK